MEQVTKKVLERIKKCLALATSANSNEAEAALRQAKKLMKKYQLSDADVALSDVGESGSKLKNTNRFPEYLLLLAADIAAFMGCEKFVSLSGGKSEIIFVGVSPNDELAAYSFDVLSKLLQKDRNKFIQQTCIRVRKRSEKTRRADIFCLGWCISIQKKLEKMRVTIPLVVEQYVDVNFPDLNEELNVRKSNFRKSNVDRNALLGGVEAGDNIDLHKPMPSSVPQPRIEMGKSST